MSESGNIGEMSGTGETTTPRARSPWRWLLLVYYLLVVVGLMLFEAMPDTPLPLVLAGLLGAQVVWSLIVVARADWTPARRALAVVGLALGIISIASPLLVAALGWSRGLPVLYGWERRSVYTITPGWYYVGFFVFTSPAYAIGVPPGTWFVKAAQAARRYPWCIAGSTAAGLALCFSGELTLQVSPTMSAPLIDAALALVAVQIGVGIYGLLVYPTRHRAEGAMGGIPAPWIPAAGYGWLLGLALALLADYVVALVAGVALLMGR